MRNTDISSTSGGSMLHRHDTRIDLLSGVSLFAEATRHELAAVAALVTEWEIPAGKVLCREGGVGVEFFIVVDGKAGVSIGCQPVTIVGPGGFFGEMALLDGGPRVATVTALTATHLLVLTRKEFDTLLSDVPSVSRRMLIALAARLRQAESNMHPRPIGV